VRVCSGANSSTKHKQARPPFLRPANPQVLLQSSACSFDVERRLAARRTVTMAAVNTERMIPPAKKSLVEVPMMSEKR
jgi:hypothetical protein